MDRDVPVASVMLNEDSLHVRQGQPQGLVQAYQQPVRTASESHSVGHGQPYQVLATQEARNEKQDESTRRA
jgi:hypothetical protein